MCYVAPSKTDTVIRSFRVPRELLEWLTAEAEAENRSVNNLVVHLLDNAHSARAVSEGYQTQLDFGVERASA